MFSETRSPLKIWSLCRMTKRTWKVRNVRPCQTINYNISHKIKVYRFFFTYLFIFLERERTNWQQNLGYAISSWQALGVNTKVKSELLFVKIPLFLNQNCFLFLVFIWSPKHTKQFLYENSWQNSDNG